MGNVMDVLRERGFIQQVTYEDELYDLLGKQSVTFYCGFDPTADSLHIGHYIPVMAMAHMQQHGHRPIALVGGGTAMVGDPSGRTDMRLMMTKEKVAQNAAGLKRQLSRFMDFSDGKALMADNADWLMGLNYVDFLRDIGVHFSVNRMLTAECYRSRMEKGLSFLEFNYMLMQSYDFLVLNQQYGCCLQMGGDDQWSNMLSGADLIRRKEHKPAFACTFQLLTTSEGVKMGKTVGGALWLDPERTSPYEFYQYWRNVDDRDVERCLALLTFLPMEEVRRLGALPGERINEAKRVLAFEVTQMVHGEEEARKAQSAAEALFGDSHNLENIPTTTYAKEVFLQHNRVVELLVQCGLAPSNSAARRLIQQGAVKAGDVGVTDVDARIALEDLQDGSILIKKGKKGFHRILVEG
jgi:tyrosyl-tRNA synthetase